MAPGATYVGKLKPGDASYTRARHLALPSLAAKRLDRLKNPREEVLGKCALPIEISSAETHREVIMQSNKSNGSNALWARGLKAVCVALAMVLGAMTSPAQAAPFAYVANHGSDTVSVIDTATNTVVATVGVGSSPVWVAVTPDGTHAYVVNQGSKSVSVIDTATNTVEPTVITVGLAPGALAIAPDGKHAYVTSTLLNTVSVIDLATNTVESAVIAVGSFPAAVAVTPDGKHVYVINSNSNNVSVIDTASNMVVATIPLPVTSATGDIPNAVAVSPDGTHVYVAAVGFNGIVSVIDTATNTVEPTVIIVGNAPSGVAVTPDGKQTYVTNDNDNTVTVIDTTTNPNMVVATVAVGLNPLGVAITPDGKRAYVANAVGPAPAGTVSVIDTASKTVVGTSISVGKNPFGVGMGIMPPACVPFLAFSAKLDVDLEPNPNEDHFELLSSFTLGPASDGVNPLIEAVALQIGTFTTTVPAGSFKDIGQGIFVFHGVIGGVRLEVLLAPTGSLRYAFVAAAQDANLIGTVNPVPVTLTIGDDCGTASVQALISH